jgi:hypothetical protein
MSKIVAPTDRRFGLTFAAIFAVIGTWFTWRANQVGVPLLGVALAFAVIALVAARLLHPLNVAWMRLGILLNKVVSPVVLGAIFFLVFTPVSLLFRIIGRDALKRTYEPELTSYWVERTPPGPDGKSLPRQF